jgi:anthranilate synthase
MQYRFTTPTGITLTRRTRALSYATALAGLSERLDRERGALFSSGVDYPGRYTRWEFGFVAPPLEIVGRERNLIVRALNPRGEKLLAILAPVLRDTAHARVARADRRELMLEIAHSEGVFAEEERSLQPSLFSPLRRLIGEFRGVDDTFLGLYGAFGYDLLFQFEPIALARPRPPETEDVHLYLPDTMFVVDRRKEQAFRHDYELAAGEISTLGVRTQSFGAPIAKPKAAAARNVPLEIVSDHTPEEYASLVERARERMRVGDIFEVVLSRNFERPYDGAPSALFQRLKTVNPSPFEFLIQLGPEQLVGTSPEMFVRVEGDRVESCPISGTARRGRNAMEDAERLKALIDSEKDEVELTMCTDVDRNDKSRVCQPGTIKLLARRLIETYAGLFHTVDHVEGRLRPGLDGIDAFLSHMWAVTLTGAPKKMATQIVEEMEKSPRGWYGGAVGALMLSGDVSTGITIRTVHLKEGVANYRVGSTLVWDSIGREEDEETRIKATAMIRAFAPPGVAAAAPAPQTGTGVRVVMIDNEDSFVHTLADYFRQTGAEVATYRHGLPVERIVALAPNLVVHSPGPGRPEQFGMPALVRALAAEGIPQFGVCLGLQGMVEAFGGSLDVLAAPRHGKFWDVKHDADPLFAGVPSPARVGAYHSLTARLADFPHDELAVIARTAEGLVMAIRHRKLPLAAVQFHPESILSMSVTAKGEIGRIMIDNVMRTLGPQRSAPGAVAASLAT